MANTVECVYTSCACNRTPHCVDWGQNGLVCYGSCRAIIVCTPKQPAKVLHTLVGHSDRVNCVQWIKRPDNRPETELLSCATDKTARLWRKTDGGEYQCTHVLSEHTSTVTVCRAVYITPPGHGNIDSSPTAGPPAILVATASVDSTLKIWRVTGDEAQCIQTVPFGTGFVLDISWVILPDTHKPLLVCGGDDQKVYIMVQNQKEFHPVLKLAGHEDWIRCLDLTVEETGDVLLASAAQDHFIRIWRISPRDPEVVAAQARDTLDLQPGEDIKMKENTFFLEKEGIGACYAVTLESVLQGHEHWVYAVRWQPPFIKDGKRCQPLRLLSASMDKTMILWEADPEYGVWVEQVRVGTVGGNTLGLYGGVFSPDGATILAHGYQGAFHMWHRQTSSCWAPGVTVGGHFDTVRDISWEPVDGRFLLSASADQTTRLHGYWKADDKEESAWHEVARPQVHGHDLTCLTMLDRLTLASGADEKVVRVFSAPANFVDNIHRLCGVDLKQHLQGAVLPEDASVPALGLSNKAVFDAGGERPDLYGEGELRPQSNSLYDEAYFSPRMLTEPPPEGDLLQNTLWPEVQKLYGHGYEVYTLAAHPDGSLLASACKAAKAEHAAVLLWDRASWRQVGRLASHALTVTQLAFSHSGDYLLSVSRDRTWALYRRRQESAPESDPLYSCISCSDKKSSQHARIIWSCAWSHDDKYFVTVSRDKKAVIWGWSNEQAGDQGGLGPLRSRGAPLVLADSITAVDFAPVHTKDNGYLIAFGLDDGTLHLYRWTEDGGATSWTHCVSLKKEKAHHLTVCSLRFCPRASSPELWSEVSQETSQEVRSPSAPSGAPPSQPSVLLLASCGADHAVKIHQINLDSL